ncbi:hypothetical protein BOTNAR_0335g00030 [Botryotinia narcissicola]|uniref:Uncharacterized protein n=1 Tax=Botryotinia narcissicola TaxID=278944 RepID=A0A4Z1HY05_9HELO|nr:hypothetical protein BOTNAR_0335g00030 [Botryotinia narcissicola]
MEPQRLHKTPCHTSAPSSNYVSGASGTNDARPGTAVPHARNPSKEDTPHPWWFLTFSLETIHGLPGPKSTLRND